MGAEPWQGVCSFSTDVVSDSPMDDDIALRDAIFSDGEQRESDLCIEIGNRTGNEFRRTAVFCQDFFVRRHGGDGERNLALRPLKFFSPRTTRPIVYLCTIDVPCFTVHPADTKQPSTVTAGIATPQQENHDWSEQEDGHDDGHGQKGYVRSLDPSPHAKGQEGVFSSSSEGFSSSVFVSGTVSSGGASEGVGVSFVASAGSSTPTFFTTLRMI